MAYPVRQVRRPAVLAGQVNGKLPPNILTTVAGQRGGPKVRLVEPAARAWQALCAAALGAGHTLEATSVNDSYRPYTVQEQVFRERYTTTPVPGQKPRKWKGQRWYQRPDTATAAVPGTSNHGWGLAVDTGEERDHDTGTESLSQAGLTWLIVNEERFGFSHELQSEPWHIHYFAGDAIPTAVHAHTPTVHAPMPPTPPDDGGEHDMPLTDTDVTKTWTQDGIIDNRPWRADAAANPKIRPASAVQISMDEAHAANTKADQILAALAAAAQTNAATLAAIETLTAHGPNVDTKAVIDAINAVGTAESAAIAALHEQIAALQAQLAAAKAHQPTDANTD